ncbi:MAG: type IV secretion protein IcmE, partial [Legionella sp.]
ALKAAGFSDTDLANAGFTPQEISAAIPLTDAQIKAAGCDPDQLKKLLAAGVSAKQIKTLNGCSAQALKNAGYNAKSLLDAGYTPAELSAAGYTADQLQAAGLSPADILASGRVSDCSVDSLKKARAAGISALTIKQTLGCSAQALKDAGYSAKDLKDAGFTAAELKKLGFSAADLKNAGFSARELKDAGFSATDLKNAGFGAKDLKDAGFSAVDLQKAGFSAAQLKDAGYTAKELKDAGFSADDLRKAGFSAKQLKDAGFSAAQLKKAGFSPSELKDAGFTPEESQLAGLQDPNLKTATSTVGGIPTVSSQPSAQAKNVSSTQQLQAILNKQNQMMAEQKYQQRIQQKTSDMLAMANTSIQEWKKVSTQVYAAAPEEPKSKTGAEENMAAGALGATELQQGQMGASGMNNRQKMVIKTGDIVFAVMDTAVNSDEPGPILATIVSGKLKGSKLIGTFNLPGNSDKMVITFNTMSVPGISRTISVSAYAIDPNTARTALSSRTNHHYLTRYGSLFASSFLEGFGNAFQSANTTVTIGGTGGGNNITVQNGVGRSTLENAVIGLATVGKSWGQQVQQLFNKPTTVEVYSGTGMGILFTQDVSLT